MTSPIQNGEDVERRGRVSRARFIAAATAAASGALLPDRVQAAINWFGPGRRTVDIVRLDTGERYTASFTDDGVHLNAPGYVLLCDALRDNHPQPINPATGRRGSGIVQMSPALLQLLWEIGVRVAMEYGPRPMILHSGYRTRATNSAIEGAVKNSIHIAGGAADLHYEGVPLLKVAQYAREVPLIGGVGTYQRGASNSDVGWLHVDVGYRREWTG